MKEVKNIWDVTLKLTASTMLIRQDLEGRVRVFEKRKKNKMDHNRDYITAGSSFVAKYYSVPIVRYRAQIAGTIHVDS